jgi:hypothetical protein
MDGASTFDILNGLALGVALAAACGFRVFVPPLVLSLAALSGHLTLTPGLGFLGTWPAALVLGVATVVEIAAYYIPWLDHLLDHLGAPLAVLAGIVVSASAFVDLPPLMRWSLAVVAGGSAAAAIHISTAGLRAVVGLATAGLGNFLVATTEALLAVLVAVLAVLLPFVALFVLLLLAALAVRIWRRRSRRPAAITG